MRKTFEKKGINVNYTNSVLMVDNYLPMFDMAHEKAIKNYAEIDRQIESIKKDIDSKKEYKLSKKSFTDVPHIEKILEKTMTRKFSIVVGEGCVGCQVCSRVCPQDNITLTEDKPVLADNYEFCLGCVHHCKSNVLNINKEQNPSERFINPFIKLSEIIKSNI